jgi:primosomal replication protein N
VRNKVQQGAIHPAAGNPAVNQLQLDAAVVEREILRYTPAGIPMLEVLLQHRSEVIEAGLTRQIDMTVPALVAGTLSGSVQRLELGRFVRMTGFLAPKRRNARTLVFHITELQDIGKD